MEEMFNINCEIVSYSITEYQLKIKCNITGTEYIHRFCPLYTSSELTKMIFVECHKFNNHRNIIDTPLYKKLEGLDD